MENTVFGLVREWHASKNLTHKDNLTVQTLKLLEELGEFENARIHYLFDDSVFNFGELIDAVGDTLICCSAVLDILAKTDNNTRDLESYIVGLTDIECPQPPEFRVLVRDLAQDSLKRKYLSLESDIVSVIVYLNKIVCDCQGDITRFDQEFLIKCMEQAYDVIKDRQGKIVNGNFVKSEDL